jgi:signal transduction histidine kinase
MLEQLTVPFSDHGHILNRVLLERKPLLVEDAFNNPDVPPDLARIIGVDTFLILPLISRNRRVGIIIADNFITHKPITPKDMQSLATLSFPVAFAIERASLYERLYDDLRKLTIANARLQEQQELIIRMEKLALLGKITSSIAHSIRNPLMIVGGFARSLMKNIAEDDPKKESLETIVQGAKQLEDSLSEVLGYADSIFPAMDLWDVNQLVGNVFREVSKKAESEGIPLTLDLARELPMIYMDYRQIAYCIKKIITYSLDTMSLKGEIYLGTRLEEDSILVDIRDILSRSDKEIADPFPGSGVTVTDSVLETELSFCRVILENYCKSFTVEEYEGKGMRYALRLPLRKENNDHG